MSCVHFPNLANVSVVARSAEDLFCLLTFPNMLDNVRDLTLRIRFVELDHIRHFFSHTPRIESLDILDSDSDILQALTIPFGQGTASRQPDAFLCRNIRDLLVKSAGPSVVGYFMECRHPVVDTMRFVLFRSGLEDDDDYGSLYNDEYGEDFDWVAERVSVGTNKVYVDQYWVHSEFGWSDQ